MKKIIFFSKNLCIGGMENALVNLLNVLVNNYDVTLVLEKCEGVLLKKLDNRVKIEEYSLSSSKNVIIRKIHNYTKRLLWSLRNRNKYDFSCNYATYSIIGSKLAQVASRNSAYYVHSNYYAVYEGNESAIKDFFRDHEIEKYNSIICVSNEGKQGLIEVYPSLQKKFCVINNLIDSRKILNMAKLESNLFQKQDINFLFLGRLENESKNLDLLLESFKKVVENDKRCKLYIVGTGPYKNSIEVFIKENNLSNNVLMVGEQTNPYPYLKNCDCLILTSNYEGFPVIFIEALVLNVPIMSTISCSDDVINMKQYITLLKKDSDAIANKILNFKKEKRNYDIDFDKLNEEKIKELISLIER